MYTHRETASEAVAKGFAVVASNLDDAISVSDKIAPEHLEIMTADAMEVRHTYLHTCMCVYMWVSWSSHSISDKITVERIWRS
jgi:histidinol dehydrogenase